MIARAALLTLTSSLLLLGGAGAASAHRPVPPPRGDVDVRLLCDAGSCDEVFHGGQRYVVGEHGQRYVIALTNRSGRWVEAVVTVDGRNIVDGQRSSSRSRGYLIAPYDSVQVEGWRTSLSEVAAFRFTSVGDSYAGRVGDARLAGTIRVEVFPERAAAVILPPHRPYDRFDEDAPEYGPRGDTGAEKRAPSSANRDDARRRHYDGGQNLGTQFGESRWQPVQERDFVRANPNRPSQTTTLRYDDRRGLTSRGILSPPRWIEDHDRWVDPPPPRAW